MARIGLLGGAFDPPHNGHIAAACAVRLARKLDRVDLLVSGTPPHQSGKQAVASAFDRAAMAALAARSQPGLDVELLELDRHGPSYSIDTLLELHAAHPGNEYCFIVGGDMLADLPRWKRIRELLLLVDFVPVFRPGHGPEVFAALESALGAGAATKLRQAVVNTPALDISSTRLRQAIAAGESIQHLVPEKVEQYIRARGLYRQP